MMNVFILIGMGLYLFAMVCIGLWHSRRSNSSPEEYFLGKRGLGPWVAALSAEASDMSGWLLMGLPGVAYFTGSGEAFWTAVGLALGTLLNWILVAKRLRSYSQNADNAITLPDFFSKRFHDNNHILSIIAALIILVFFSIYVGSQFIAFGKLFSYVFSADQYVTMVILGAFLVMLYTFLGGFLAESMTDLIQGILMFFSLIVVLVTGFIVSGGFAGIAERVQDFPRFLDIFGIATPTVQDGVQTVINGIPQFGSGSPYSLLNIISCLAWGLGYFGMPQVLLRFMAINRVSQVRTSSIIAVTWCFISLFAAVSIGLIGRAYLPDLLRTAGSSETIFLELATRFFPPLVAGLILSGVLAASMSSADSYMLIASSALAHDLVKGLFKKNASETFVLWVARVSILVVTVFGVGIALSDNSSIFEIVSYAWAGFGAAFGPLILFSLFWRRTTLAGAIGGMLSGGAMVIIWKQFISKAGGIFAVYELLPAFIISSLVIFIGSLITPEPSLAIHKEFERFQEKLNEH
ncbi:MAG: sodium/proline symporter PutP [Treponema sp.]|jgi:sodium/proline symporter|nr:sodium/proline symporter PutP [Treponema sp.]